ncbi:uncharacterized protein TRUGW13939_02699 [Talaromyces rugulosus]|uniref:D-xylose 1-dehydrogenase (NADP(+), D-xylono-1,5-lactone-forming) n=1 Tax=Talaromyces rugulosus TaxID=121627 RepID=A0A7H8QR38_TALRU|nr:uncharacterized protein TRUGW13939_02699 [Talaromyces rugulosus]QKX55603.1 hypothetical protein TRUGW13939_02699 [Talaromyces rugulosus]
MISTLYRIITAFGPPTVEKDNGSALKFGILGAAQIAPMTLITPAKSHPEVIVQAVAARDRSRAEAFAKKHGVPEVKDSYQDILDDPNIDAVLIPLANSFHLEWSIRAIRAGKHVLLEKPSVNTAAEAEILFNMPELSQPNAPIILEAFHNRFHPAVQLFLSFISPRDVEHVYTDCMVPWWMVDNNNIGYQYELGGGSMMHLGTYTFAILRMIFNDEPEECLTCKVGTLEDGVHDKCDADSTTTFRFPNGGMAEAKSTFRGPILWKPSEARVTHREVFVEDKSLPATQEKVRVRKVTIHGFLNAFIWHRIDVEDSYIVRNKENPQQILKKWVESKSHKAYSYKEAGGKWANLPGEDWWMSYRWQLEEFVNRIKGRQAAFWISGQDSINQMKMVDMAYEKSGLGLRKTGSFR